MGLQRFEALDLGGELLGLVFDPDALNEVGNKRLANANACHNQAKCNAVHRKARNGLTRYARGCGCRFGRRSQKRSEKRHEQRRGHGDRRRAPFVAGCLFGGDGGQGYKQHRLGQGDACREEITRGEFAEGVNVEKEAQGRKIKRRIRKREQHEKRGGC